MALTEQESKALLIGEMDRQGMTDNALRAGTAAIAMGESALNPHTETPYNHTSNDRIRSIFRTRLSGSNDAFVDALKADPEKFFEYVYNYPGNQLGNTQPGDGFKFRGRTVLQLTGRSNYAELARRTGYDLVNDPDSANTPQVSAAVAVAYMLWRYHSGGWPAMKKAVGNNSPDIDARKNSFYTKFLQSHEFDYKATVAVIPVTPVPPVEIVRLVIPSALELQRELQTLGYYKGALDGDKPGGWGPQSQAALAAYYESQS